MINKEFAPYEESLKLKELGFDEKCLGRFVKHYDQIKWILNSDDFDYWWTENSDDLKVVSPLYSQAFRWFREKYEYTSFIRGRKSMGFDYTLSDVPTNLSKKDIFQSPHVYETYEEAELACLRKLIEIVKNQSN